MASEEESAFHARMHLGRLQRAGIKRLPKSAEEVAVETSRVAKSSFSEGATDALSRPPVHQIPILPAVASGVEKAVQLEALSREAEACRRCTIGTTRNKLVFGVGNPNATLVFVGEAPGQDEDARGEPFVGRAGKLLDKMIVYMGLKRSDVYIMNTLKCHPPGNRNPSSEELENCKDFFIRQLDILQPRVIVALGAFAAQRLLSTDKAIGQLRGRFHEYRGIAVMATYHPAFLLRSPSPENRERVKSDLRLVGERFFGRTDWPTEG